MEAEDAVLHRILVTLAKETVMDLEMEDSMMDMKDAGQVQFVVATIASIMDCIFILKMIAVKSLMGKEVCIILGCILF